MKGLGRLGGRRLGGQPPASPPGPACQNHSRPSSFHEKKCSRRHHIFRMPRSARIVAVGVPHHVTQRGNHRAPIFFSQDHRAF